MKIISHRGYWKNPLEKNTEIAFRRSFELGFGTETDIRDLNGSLVISHDMPKKNCISLNEFMNLIDVNLPLALNIKSDGLADHVRTTMNKFKHTNWFVFDMSIPDMRMHLKAGNPVFTRLSEIETLPILLEECEGIWLDQFDSEWFDTNYIANLLNNRKRICVVSSELHRRNHLKLWELIKPLKFFDNLMLCTDLPEEARTYFC